MLKKCLALVLCATLLLTGCSDNSSSVKNDELAGIREYASSYSELVNGRDAVFSLTEMLSYYNDASYKKASSSARVSNAVRAEYFPSVNWEGSEFLATEQTASIAELYVSSFSDAVITYTFLLRIASLTELPQVHMYQAVYSLNSDEIVEVTKIY